MNRRDVLKVMAVAPAAASAQHPHPAESLAQIARPRTPAIFPQAQYRLLSRLADLIIPRSDTPGAVDAGVPLLIDAAVEARPELRPRFEAGFALVDELAAKHGAADFLDLPERGQIAVLTHMSEQSGKDAGEFFQLLKEMTIDTYYSTRQGLVQELGYHGNTFLPAFPGCTHPEHQG